MNSEDETRVMPVPPELRALMGEATPSPDAETPCVGVPSVGDTHFGETQLVLSIKGKKPALDRVPSAPEVTSPESAHKDRPGANRSSQLVATRTSRNVIGARLPRPLALGIGLGVGLGAALVIGLLQNRRPDPRADLRPTVSVETFVHTEEGVGLCEVPVRMQNHVVLTDESGRAPFPSLSLHGPLKITAECPSGYSGGRLAREIPQGVAASSKVWTFHLVCRPEFSEVTLLVETEGCGEMRISIDGAPSGTTSAGRWQVSRRIHAAEVVEVKAEPLDGSCEFEDVRHVSLSTQTSTTSVFFKGKARRPLSRGRKTTSLPLRPYRL